MAFRIPNGLKLRLASTKTLSYLTTYAIFGIPMMILFSDHVADITEVDGASMSPTLNPERNSTMQCDYVLNWKLIRRDTLTRGTIVTMQYVNFNLFDCTTDMPATP